MKNRTIAELLVHGQIALTEVGIEEADTDARLLLEFVLGKSRTQLFLAAKDYVTEKQQQTYLQLLGRRLQREPVSYIIETREFWSLPFFVSKDVLIPRPETEFLLEKVFENVSQDLNGKVLDLCCGSGIIGCIIAKQFAGVDVTAVDISVEALNVTRKNCTYHQVADRVSFVQSDLFDSIDSKEPFNLIVSNPPYISTDDVNFHLAPEVSEFEPRLALDGGERGLDVIERIAEQLDQVIARPGHFFMEFGSEQGPDCKKIFNQLSLFDSVTIYKDYAGRDRVLHAFIN